MVNRFIGLLVERLGCTLLAFAKFLQGATGLASPEARSTVHVARENYVQHLARRYSRPTRCC